jgi:hypothetical protein
VQPTRGVPLGGGRSASPAGGDPLSVLRTLPASTRPATMNTPGHSTRTEGSMDWPKPPVSTNPFLPPPRASTCRSVR